jgi:hypothetical protein
MRYRLIVQPDAATDDPPETYVCQGHRTGDHQTIADYLIPVGSDGTTVLPLCGACLRALADELERVRKWGAVDPFVEE